MRFLFGVLSLYLVVAQEKFFATFEYATPYPVSASPWQSYNYAAYMCNQPLYDGKVVTLSVNLPYASWDWDSQNVVFVNIYSSPAMGPSDLVGSNLLPDGKPNITASWIYNSSRGDSNLYVVYSVRGVITTLVFTSSLGFSNPTNYVPAPFVKVDTDVPNSNAVWISYREIIKGEQLYVVLTGPSQKPTPILIDFSFCPPPNVTSYTLVVQVVAANTKSAMSLFICLPDKLPCSSANSDPARQDPAGIAVATVVLSTTNGLYKFIEAAVYGVGEYNNNNTFYFIVSSTLTNN